MKRTLMILIMCMGLVLAACGGAAEIAVVEEPAAEQGAEEAVEEAAVEEVAEDGLGEGEWDLDVLSGSWNISLQIEGENVTLLSFPSEEELIQGELTLRQPLLICIENALDAINAERDAAGISEAQEIDLKISIEIDPDGATGNCVAESETFSIFTKSSLEKIPLNPLVASYGIEHPGCYSSWGICTEDSEDPCPIADILGTCYETECHRCAVTDKGLLKCGCSPTTTVVPCPP